MTRAHPDYMKLYRMQNRAWLNRYKRNWKRQQRADLALCARAAGGTL